MSTRLSFRKFLQVLDITKLDEVIEVLQLENVPKSSWFELGMRLGILRPTLTAIEASHGRDHATCFVECLSLWLTAATTAAGPETVEKLAIALRKFDDTATAAENIYRTLPASQLLQRYSDRLSQVVLSEASVQLLHTEGVISKNTLAQVEGQGGSLAGEPLGAVRVAVVEDHNKLRVLASVLLRFNETQSLAKELLNDCDEIIPDISGAIETPMLVDQATMLDEEFYLIEAYNYQFDEIRVEFGNFLDKTIPLLIQKILSPDDVKGYLQRCFPEFKQLLFDVTSVKDVMSVVEKKCTIINIVPIKAIVARYGVTEAEELIADYSEVIDKFCSKVTLNVMANRKLLYESLLKCETIKFVLNWRPDEHSLNDIRHLVERAFTHMNERVVIQSIQTAGSITVLCYAPRYLTNALLLQAQKNLPDLKSDGVIQMTIGHYNIYNGTITDEELTILREKYQQKLRAERGERLFQQQMEEKKRRLEEVQQKLRENEEYIETLKTPESELKQELEKKEEEARSMTQEIERLKSSIQTKEELEKELKGNLEEIELLEEKVSTLTAQVNEREEKNKSLLEDIEGLQTQLDEVRSQHQTDDDKDAPKKDRSSVAGDDRITTMESLELFEFVSEHRPEIVVPAAVQEILDKPLHTLNEKIGLFVKAVEENAALLAPLREAKRQYEERGMTGKVEWLSTDTVQLTRPTAQQCREVIANLRDNHRNVNITSSSPDIVLILLPPVLQKDSVKELEIRQTPLTMQCIQSLSYLLTVNTTLQSLVVSSCSITDELLDWLCLSLQHNRGLASLDLRSNNSVTSKSARSVSELLRANSTLTRLFLYRTLIASDGGIPLLLNALTDNKTLTKLGLNGEHRSACRQHANYAQIEHRLDFQ